MQTIIAFFGHLDPREQNSRHDFCEMLFIVIAATLCGAGNCTDYWRFAQEKEVMLRQVLRLAHGIPSHDTFSALFRYMDPKAFAAAFSGFTRAFAAAAASGPRHIAIDGKAMRGAFDTGQAFAPRMLVSAWGREVRMTLAVEPAERGNEVAAALRLLATLDLKGATVTADALHCQRKIARTIAEKGGDYLLQVKGNQPHLEKQALKKASTSGSPFLKKAK